MDRQTKTPDEMACGLECIRTNVERVCVKPEKGQCPRCEQLVEESLALIQQLKTDNAEKDKRIAELEQELAAVKRERDAAIRDCSEFPCKTCDDRENRDLCCNCIKPGSTRRTNHVWRGVCPDTEVQEDG